MLDVNNFDSMKIGLASPDQIKGWSYGEVTKPETINYRTLKPERDGLFCEKIFGPTKDWECHCGKYKRVRFKGIICDRCGVEVTRSKVRRERMGHIELAAPVSHIWYFKGIPSRMGLILNLTPRELEQVLYFAKYIVLDSGDTGIVKNKDKDLVLLSEQEYSEAVDKFGESAFRVGMGAEAIRELLTRIDLDSLAVELRKEIEADEATAAKNAAKTGTIAKTISQKRLKAIRRLEVCEAFRKSGNRPEWMIMDIVPVIPPELRPMVQLDGGRFATSDLNDLYRRVINRNNRLKKLLQTGAPNIIVRNEKRMLQEAVDALIDNGRRGRPVTGPGNRPLKSLSDMLKGKQGRFRQNLLGKRVDYSGRSVIVVGPDLKMHQCGLPKEMALELFKPFVMKKLVNSGMSPNIKNAKQRVERADPSVWDVLEEVIKEHPVLLNRAPTLHRLGIQAFEPILSEGRAIKIHPLVCTAYNADFDGDQMAVHVPLSAEAQSEARMLMLSSHNILAPKDGKPVAVPSQDMILGAYYLTISRPGSKGEGKIFATFNEALLAYQHGVVHLQAPIKVRMDNDQVYPIRDIPGSTLVNTTVGSMIFNEILPPEIKYFYQDDFQHKNNEWYLMVKPDYDAKSGNWIPQAIGKKELGKLVAKAFDLLGNTRTAELLDAIKKIGFSNACRAGITIAVSDIKVPERKGEIIAATEQEVEKIERMFRRGLFTEPERYRKVIELWDKTVDLVTKELMGATLDSFNPVYMMANSGARGNTKQIRQLAGMRGLMADPSGKIIDLPIKANFREGLTVLEYFISTHGARKGLADTALRTADSGYLTRRLVDVAQDVIVRDEDCDVDIIDVAKARQKIHKQLATKKIGERLLGRMLSKAIADPLSKKDLVAVDTVINQGNVNVLYKNEIPSVQVYRLDAQFDDEVEELPCSIMISDEEVNKILMADLQHRAENYDLEEDLIDDKGSFIAQAGDKVDKILLDRILDNHEIQVLKVRRNEVQGIEIKEVRDDKTLVVSFRDRIVGRVLAEDIIDEATGKVKYHKNELVNEKMADDIAKFRTSAMMRSVLNCKSKHGVCRKCYGRNLATGKIVDIGESVGIIAAQSIGEPGTQLTMRTFHTGGVAGDDITQGLPRVEELFEARKPKRSAIICRETGKIVAVNPMGEGGSRELVLVGLAGHEEKYVIPYTSKKQFNVGDELHVGESITEGDKHPNEILQVLGVRATQEYLVNEVQRVYKNQGVEINDRHIEVIVRQMMRKVKIEEIGDSVMLPSEYIDVNQFRDENKKLQDAGKEPATGKSVILGITKASLATDSFLSAASFQETTRVLTDAAIKGKVDPLIGLKENVIIGKLVPAGTGMSRYRNVQVKKNEAME